MLRNPVEDLIVFSCIRPDNLQHSPVCHSGWIGEVENLDTSKNLSDSSRISALADIDKLKGGSSRPSGTADIPRPD